MKKLIAALLLISVAANAALVYRLAHRAGEKEVVVTRTVAKASAASSASGSLAAALASNDAAALAAAGLSPEQIRDFALGKVVDRYFAGMIAALGDSSSAQFWRGGNFRTLDPKQRMEWSRAQQDLMLGFAQIYGDKLPRGMGGSGNTSFLPADKQAKLLQVRKDYDDMRLEITGGGNMGGGGPLLQADKDKLKLLQKEQDRDIAAAMTPDEFAEYQKRSSSTASTVQNQYGDAIQSEDQYNKIYALQKTFDDQYGDSSGTDPKARSAAQDQLSKEIADAIGSDAIAAYRKTNDNDYQSLASLGTRLNLPSDTADQVYASRDTYATQSQQIADNPSLTAAQRKDQYAAIAIQAKADLVAKLGQDGADAYAKSASWYQILSRGNAITTSPSAGAGSNSNSLRSPTVSAYRPPGSPARSAGP